jgi:hypothetical protein
MPLTLRRGTLLVLSIVTLLAYAMPAGAQAALLMEEPYGFFGTLNPTGHTAIYFSRICAATPVKLRRCDADETGVVIARYQGIAGYDWVAIPLIPYLYSVEDAADVPQRGIAARKPGVAVAGPLHGSTHTIPIAEIDVVAHADLVAVIQNGRAGKTEQQRIQ